MTYLPRVDGYPNKIEARLPALMCDDCKAVVDITPENTAQLKATWDSTEDARKYAGRAHKCPKCKEKQRGK